MRRLFIRVYLILSAAMLISFFIILTALLVSSGLEMSKYESHYSKASHNYLISEVDKYPNLEMDDIIKKVQPYISYDISWIPMSELSLNESQMDKIKEGYPLTDVWYSISSDHVGVFWYVPSKNGVVLYQRAQETNVSNKGTILAIGLAGLLVLPLSALIFLRPIGKQLVEFTHYVRRYAQGILTDRIPLEGSKPFIELAVDINTMADRLEKQINNQLIMSNAISHELKTPLTRLRMGNDLVQTVDNHEELKKYVESVAEELDQFEKLVKSILTLARYTHKSKQLIMESIDLNSLLRQVIEQFTNKNIEIKNTIEDTILVESNSDGLSHILINIIGNAACYTNEQVIVSVSMANGYGHLFIDDDGPGIPKEQRQKIFTPFSLLDDSRSKEQGGTGLGLAIVEAIAEKINCKVIVGDSDIGGARFDLRLPLA